MIKYYENTNIDKYNELMHLRNKQNMLQLNVKC